MESAIIKREDIIFALTSPEIHHLVNHTDEPFSIKRGQITIELTQQERQKAREVGIYNHIVGRLLGTFCMMSPQAEQTAKEIMQEYDISRFPAGLEEILYNKSEEKLNEMEEELPFS